MRDDTGPTGVTSTTLSWEIDGDRLLEESTRKTATAMIGGTGIERETTSRAEIPEITIGKNTPPVCPINSAT
jgi:hypothetical protein